MSDMIPLNEFIHTLNVLLEKIFVKVVHHQAITFIVLIDPPVTATHYWL